MQKKRIPFSIIFLLSILFACKTNKQTTSNSGPLPSTDSDVTVNTKVTKTDPNFSPSSGSSVVIAKILEISNEHSAVHPCSEASCYAFVQIEKVVRLSGNLTNPFTDGQKGKMRFVFTLNETTKELFPNLDKRLPGLKLGDRFKANVTEEQLLGMNGTQWVAYDYILLN